MSSMGQEGRARLYGMLAAMCALAAPAQALGAEADELRARFRAAYAAADSTLAVVDDADLQGYVLYPYLRAARIERALAGPERAWNTADDAALALVTEQGAAPVGTALRRAWLASLARRELWQAFLDHYDPAIATVALECQHWSARIAVGTTADLTSAVAARWLTPYRLPPECEPPFQWLRAQRALTDELIEQRVELLLDNGQTTFARNVARRLPPESASRLIERADFIDKPAATLDAWAASPDWNADVVAVRDGWARLARDDPDAALARFAVVTGRSANADEAAELSLRLALGLAWDRRSEALDYFARVPATALDDAAREWQARAAMWAGDWELVAAAIAAMSEQSRAQVNWRYWAARAAEGRALNAEAEAAYGAILDTDNYYSAMAATRLGKRIVPRQMPFPPEADAIDSIALRPPFERARELSLVDLRTLATVEWQHGYAELPEEQRPQAIHLAAKWELYDVAVATATSFGVFYDYELLYPRPYRDEIAAAAKLTDVDRALLYGVLRQESLFRPDVASPAGALGIAQLTYGTARATAQRWKLPVPQRADLFDADVGITLGAARLADLLVQFDAELPAALGAYNAGDAAAARWLPEKPIDSDVWIENIPYDETRAYVRRVLWHSLVFAWLETGRAQHPRSWLEPVGK
jgi:soluble lytic murein transglycosylase